MMRFVVIATLRRGVLAKPEALSADGQAAAFAEWQCRSAAKLRPAAEKDRPQGGVRGVGKGIQYQQLWSNETQKQVRRLLDLARRSA